MSLDSSSLNLSKTRFPYQSRDRVASSQALKIDIRALEDEAVSYVSSIKLFQHHELYVEHHRNCPARAPAS